MKIQSLIKGFTGEPACVYASYDPEINATVVVKEGAWTESRWKTDEELIVISNQNVPDRDVLFGEDQLIEAITEYFSLESAGEFILEETAASANPQMAVAFRGIKDGKRDYDARSNLSNKHVATLAIAHYVGGLQAIGDAQEMLDDLADPLYSYSSV